MVTAQNRIAVHMANDPIVDEPRPGTIERSLNDGVLTLRIFNPTQGNSLTIEMVKQLLDEFKQARQDPSVKAVVLRGLEGRAEDCDAAGTPKNVFCGGMNLKEVVGLLKQTDKPAVQLRDVTQYCRTFAEMFEEVRKFGEEKNLIVVSYGRRAPGMAATFMAIGAKYGHVIAMEGVDPFYPETKYGLEAYVSSRFVTAVVGRPVALGHFEHGDRVPIENYGNMEICRSREEIENAVGEALKGKPKVDMPELDEVKRHSIRVRVLAHLEGLQEDKLIKELKKHRDWRITPEEVAEHIKLQVQVLEGLRQLGEAEVATGLVHKWAPASPDQDLGESDAVRNAKITILEGLHQLDEHRQAVEMSSKWLGQQFFALGYNNLEESLKKIGGAKKPSSPDTSAAPDPGVANPEIKPHKPRSRGRGRGGEGEQNQN